MYLIIGANGQLGSELRDILGDRARYADIPEIDITDSAGIREFILQAAPRYIINCAAYTAVDKAETDEDLARAINADGAENLALAAAEAGAVFIHVSTDYVFDGEGCRPYRTESPTSPQSVYGRTKLEGEQRALAVPSATVAIVRTAWLYSTHGNNFVKTMQRLGSERESLTVIADQVGSPTYAKDLAEALVAVAEGIKPGTKETYHYTNEGVASWYDFAEEIMSLSGITCRVCPIPTEEYPTPARRPSYSLLDKSKIKKEYGLEIRHWKAALRECLQKLEEQK